MSQTSQEYITGESDPTYQNSPPVLSLERLLEYYHVFPEGLNLEKMAEYGMSTDGIRRRVTSGILPEKPRSQIYPPHYPWLNEIFEHLKTISPNLLGTSIQHFKFIREWECLLLNLQLRWKLGQILSDQRLEETSINSHLSDLSFLDQPIETTCLKLQFLHEGSTSTKESIRYEKALTGKKVEGLLDDLDIGIGIESFKKNVSNGLLPGANFKSSPDSKTKVYPHYAPWTAWCVQKMISKESEGGGVELGDIHQSKVWRSLILLLEYKLRCQQILLACESHTQEDQFSKMLFDSDSLDQYLIELMDELEATFECSLRSVPEKMEEYLPSGIEFNIAA